MLFCSMVGLITGGVLSDFKSSNQDPRSNGAIIVSYVKTDKTSTTVNITGKVQIGDKETKYYFNSYLKGYYVSSNEYVESLQLQFADLKSDRTPPVINPTCLHIVQVPKLLQLILLPSSFVQFSALPFIFAQTLHT